ncbi:MAG TPA: HAMP domain-containing protein, partial [Rhodopila sp.]|nr:HAMP domain-containing protein [Rhodopila sp.]
MTVMADARPAVEAPNQMTPDRGVTRRARFSNLSLGHKVALIPALTLLLMGMMLAVAMRMGDHNTSALRDLDRNVFEPLNRAQTLKDEITLLHTRLFALLSTGNNETNPAAQRASAEALIAQVDTEVTNINRFLDANALVSPAVASQLRAAFIDYVSRVRETASFAAYDASYGALVAGIADDKFGHLRVELDSLVRSLSQRRETLVKDAIRNSVGAQQTLLGLGLGATLLGLLGSVLVGRSIARPVLRLTGMMNQLAAGNTDLPVPGTGRRDEVGAMARAVEVFRANVIARRQSEATLRRTNLQFDAALNSMLQGMIVWGPDHRIQLVNRRF